jgi:glycosyltransferase involved in cell wall biosynthesis
MNKIIYVDISNSRNIDYVTGIQRVVINIAGNLHTNFDNVVLISYCSDGQYRRVDYGFRSQKQNSSSIKESLKKLKKFLPGSLYYLLLRIYLKLLSISVRFLRDEVVRVKEGDVVLLLDATWNYSPWKALALFKTQGATIAQVIYDLIPLKRPEFFAEELNEAFQIWFKLISIYCDRLYCISDSVVADVKEKLIEKNYTSVNLVEKFFLGCDFYNQAEKNLRHNGGGQTFISVGTIEPRKNYEFILNAFERVWADDPKSEINWIIVGKRGWKCNYIYQVLKNHPHYNKSLFFYEDASDEDLVKLYRSADCAIIASTVEGYGLPVVESLSRGCGILLSDIPVFREFKLPSESYFSLTDSNMLAERIKGFGAMPLRMDLSEDFTKSWGECSRLFYESLIK